MLGADLVGVEGEADEVGEEAGGTTVGDDEAGGADAETTSSEVRADATGGEVALGTAGTGCTGGAVAGMGVDRAEACVGAATEGCVAVEGATLDVVGTAMVTVVGGVAAADRADVSLIETARGSARADGRFRGVMAS